MKKLVIRDVPEALHQELERRAMARGRSLSGYVREVLGREIERDRIGRPRDADVFERIRSRDPVDPGRDAADLIRAERSER